MLAWLSVVMLAAAPVAVAAGAPVAQAPAEIVRPQEVRPLARWSRYRARVQQQ
jgi:hypothetical protein